MSAPLDIAALRAKLARATPGPYVKCALVQATTRDGRELPCRDQYSLRSHYRIPATDKESATIPFDFAHGMTEQDADYIAAACNAIPSLLSTLDEAAGLLEADKNGNVPVRVWREKRDALLKRLGRGGGE